jgi:hypothetical protein
VAALGRATFGSEKAIEVQNILHEHGDNVFQERANVSRLGGLCTLMEEFVLCCGGVASDIFILVCERDKRDKCGGEL